MAFGRLDVESAAQPKTDSKGLLSEVWKTGAWRLAPTIFIYVFALAILLPAKPDILTNFFASEEAGKPIHCNDYAPGQQPEVCRNAHSDAVWWGSFSDFVSHSIVTFLLAPLVGRWSDRVGRRPFIALFLLVATIPHVLLASHIAAGISLYYYFPAQAFAGTNMLVSLCTAYISDLVSIHHRASAIGLIMASFAVAFLVGPPVGGVLGLVPAATLSVTGNFLALVLLLIVPESLGEAAKDAAKTKQRSDSKWARLPWSSLGILLRSQLFIKLTACMCIIGFVALGLLEMLSQYLQLKLNFTKMDLAIVITIAGAVGLVTQTVILRVLMRFLGETRTLIFGSISRILEQLILCAAFDRATVIVAIFVGALSQLSVPAISGLVSKNSEAHEQGAAQGALYGALALSQGFGPLAFAYLFSGFTRSDSTWTYFPVLVLTYKCDIGAPYLFGALLMAICTIVACTINASDADSGIQPTGEDRLRPSEKNDSGFTTRPSADLTATGGASLIQRQASNYTPLGSQPSSSSLETVPSQKRISGDYILRTSSSAESRLPHKRSALE